MTHGHLLRDGGQYSATGVILSVPFKDLWSLSRGTGKALPNGIVVI